MEIKEVEVDLIGDLVYWWKYSKSCIEDSGYGVLLGIDNQFGMMSILVGNTIIQIPCCDVEFIEEKNENSERFVSNKER